jgi:hypothetical protein
LICMPWRHTLQPAIESTKLTIAILLKTLVHRRMMIKLAGQPAESKPAVPRSSSGVSHLVRTLVEEVLAWQGRRNPIGYGAQRIPNKHAGSFYDDSEERKLGIRFGKVLLRRDKSLGSAPSQLQLSPSEVALVNSVPGVPLHGCSATASCNSNVAQQRPGLTTILNDDIGTHRDNKKVSVGSAGTGSGGSHHASQSNRIEEGESHSSDLAQCTTAKKRPRYTGRRVVATLPVADVVTSVSTCSLCFDKPCVVAVVPCGHLCGCFDCLQLCHVCPICTDPIQTILRVYDAGISP